ncbi:hypothetical protein [Ochrobactrum sp. Marseille-Q0166]|uniref:hypothetical protein n=1 Tax=Ochrobactrum sp. Marseille-Q0166 TaxID=2761105 RepID=UPI001655C498|nr:hypothetical protein [Ochrobactrum sp. Marseille-Q0166]MBC8718833.1 hypothetical protein [Ochrobactrum sp. Marseille-Q0166]
MSIYLPTNLGYQAGRPRLNKPVSMSRYGNRAISMIQNGDEWWTVNIETQPLYDEQLAAFEGWLAQAKNGLETVVYTVLGRQSVPLAYWSDPNNAAITGNPMLTVINGSILTISPVVVGLKMKSGDLIGFSNGEYNFFTRIIADATASSTLLQVVVEPFLPSYITIGSTVRLKDAKINTRVVPGSTEVGEGVMPTVKFQLIEVPK